MSDNFKPFADIVEAKFQKMAAEGSLFQTDATEGIWDAYLDAFPEGTNPVFRERTEHDCQCCKQFIKRIGSVVSIVDGSLTTVWDIEGAPDPYQHVAQRLDAFVRESSIEAPFFSKERKYGTHVTLTLDENGDTLRFEHFEAEVPAPYRTPDKGRLQGQAVTAFGVFQRGMEELQTEALDTILEIVEADDTAIYRAVEHLPALRAFRSLKADYDQLGSPEERELFLWANYDNRAALFKNTVIGTLISDMSEGKSLEAAVRAFESKVAPHNYKRPKALITQGMIRNALSKIDELGLRSSLERRHATVRDVSINDILFVDRATEPLMKDSLKDLLMEEVSRRPDEDPSREGAVDIHVDDFLSDVLPKTTSVDVLFEGRLETNLMSVTAPVHEDTGRLFQWENDFSWSYVGGVADSLKQRVSKAGGNVTAPFRVSLGWSNTDDLDIHVTEPNGNRISYSSKRSPYGFLDVDMNVSRPVRDAVENVCWDNPPDGIYKVDINNFTKRESVDVGFELEVESQGKISRYTYPSPVAHKEMVRALELKVRDGKVVEAIPGRGVTGGSFSREVWGVSTEKWSKVRTMMLSPNHWHDKQVGNKHLFFILEDCLNPDKVRGMYNENLRADLHEHRKVFEVLASKMMCEPSQDQLSGLGFSSTQNNNVFVRVRGDINQTYDVNF